MEYKELKDRYYEKVGPEEKIKETLGRLERFRIEWDQKIEKK